MIEIDNETEFIIDEELLNNIKNSLSDKFVELIVTDNETIKEINKTHRNIDKATDVLSFPLEDMPNAPLGTIIISIDFVNEKALEYKHSTQSEFMLLFIHGMLHLLGYDHEVDNGEQRAKESELIEKFSLPDSLIVRNS